MTTRSLGRSSGNAVVATERDTGHPRVPLLVLTASGTPRRAEVVKPWNAQVTDYHQRLVELKSKATADAYLIGVWCFGLYCRDAGITDLNKASPALLEDFVRYMVTERDVSYGTAKLRLIGAQSWLKYRRLRGEKIPDFARPDLPKNHVPDPIVLDVNELSAYFAKMVDLHEPIRTVCLMMPLCGLRCEEVVRLRMDSMTVYDDGWVVFSFKGKGKKPRHVPLLRQGNTVLRQYLTGYRATRPTDNPWLFPGHLKGDHVATRTVRKWVDKIEADLGIHMSPHVLRKTYSTMLDSMGVSPFKIAQLLGHADIRVTSRHYVKHSVDTLIGDLAKVQLPGMTGT